VTRDFDLLFFFVRAMALQRIFFSASSTAEQKKNTHTSKEKN